MTTEVVLLLSLFAFVALGVFFGPQGPYSVFEKATPRLGAKIERQITTGRGFSEVGGETQEWRVPLSPPPTGGFE